MLSEVFMMHLLLTKLDEKIVRYTHLTKEEVLKLKNLQAIKAK